MNNIYDINQRASKDIDTIMYFLPMAVRRGPELVCGDMYGQSKGESFSYNLKEGCWAEFNGGEYGWGLAELLTKRDGITPQEALKKVAEAFGEEIKEVKKKTEIKKEEDSFRLKPIPDNQRPTHIYQMEGDELKSYDVSKYWTYYNGKGNPVYLDVRADLPNGKKIVVPMIWNGLKFQQKQMPEPRYMYNLKSVDADDKEQKIIIVEGAKTADAAQLYFPNYTVVSWAGGCCAWKKTNWQPLAGKEVILIPDADNKEGKQKEEQPGWKAMDELAEYLIGLSCRVKMVDTSSKAEEKDGWDLADALEERVPQQEIVAFVKENIFEVSKKIKMKRNAPTNPDEEYRINKSKEKLEYDDTYFRCLGVDGCNHYFYHKRTGQIIEFSPSNYDSKHLIMLAPLNYWQDLFPARNGVDWMMVADFFCRVQERIGIFDKTRVRGRGAWFDNGKPILHLGNTIYCEGKAVPVETYRSSYYYEKSPSLGIVIQSPLSAEDGMKFVDLCKMIRWEKKCYGSILAGWIFSSLVCGAMPFRSHLYMIGAKGSGKSWIFDNIIKPIMGNMALSVSSKSTEAGIREALGGDIRPVIFDEAEAENDKDRQRMQAVFDIARQASSENADAIVKGTAGHSGLSYICRSSFLFASINNSMSKSADLSRTALISLKCPPVKRDAEEKKKDSDAFKALEKQASILLDADYCRCFLTRAITMIPNLREAHKLIADVSAKEFGSRRLGDQMGMVLAGLWCLQHNEKITEYDAKSLIEETAMQKEKDVEELLQEERALNHLLQATVSLFNNSKYSLQYLIAFLMGYEHDDYLDKGKIAATLASKGIRIKEIDGSNYWIFSKLENSLASQLFKGTEWQDSWAKAILRLDKTLNLERAYFCHAFPRSPAVAVPTRLIIEEGGD